MLTIYAQLGVGGRPVRIPVGAPFTTFRKVVETEEESAWSFTDIGAPAAFEVSHAWSALDTWSAEDRARFCVVALEADDVAPPGHRIADYELAATPEGIVATSIFEPIPLEAYRAQRRAEAVGQYEARRQAEFAWDFAETPTKDDFGVDQGPAGPQALQMREGPGNDDQKNWSIAMTTALAFEAAGAGATPLPIKTTANVWVQTSASQVLDVLLRGDGRQFAAVQRGMALMQRVGELKAAIDAAEDLDALAAIDVTAGWPGNG